MITTLRLALCLVVTACLAASTSAGERFPLWGPLATGMTVAEVRGRFPGGEYYPPQPCGDVVLDVVTNAVTEIFGVNFATRIQFDRRRLESIAFSYRHPSPEIVQALFDRFNRMTRAELGEPTRMQGDVAARYLSVVWEAAHRRVWIEYSIGSTTRLNVTYSAFPVEERTDPSCFEARWG